MNLLNEIRILFAELLVHQALRVMPEGAPEAKPMSTAFDGYIRESAQIARWQKFPA